MPDQPSTEEREHERFGAARVRDVEVVDVTSRSERVGPGREDLVLQSAVPRSSRFFFVSVGRASAGIDIAHRPEMQSVRLSDLEEDIVTAFDDASCWEIMLDTDGPVVIPDDVADELVHWARQTGYVAHRVGVTIRILRASTSAARPCLRSIDV